MDRDISKRIGQMAPRQDPVSLTPAELDLENHPVRVAEHVIPVRAWVRFPEVAHEAEAVAFEWTDKAVHISWVAEDGARRQAWVWASSVRRI